MACAQCCWLVLTAERTTSRGVGSRRGWGWKQRALRASESRSSRAPRQPFPASLWTVARYSRRPAPFTSGQSPACWSRRTRYDASGARPMAPSLCALPAAALPVSYCGDGRDSLSAANTQRTCPRALRQFVTDPVCVAAHSTCCRRKAVGWNRTRHTRFARRKSKYGLAAPPPRRCSLSSPMCVASCIRVHEEQLSSEFQRALSALAPVGK